MAKAADPEALLAKTLADLEKKLGKGMIHSAADMPAVYHLAFRNPTLNYATEGGAPWNRSISMYGDESTGKSLALYELYAMAQGLPGSMDPLLTRRIQYHAAHGHDVVVARLREEQEWIHDHFSDGARCCHYDIEAQLDKRRAAKVGVDLDALWVVETDVIEDVCATLEGLFGLFHVHGLDSTSQAQSLLALKQEPGQSAGYGVDARQWKSSLKHALSFFGPLKNGTGIPNMLVMIHQTSMNVKTGANQAAVGKFIKFISSCTVEFQRGSFLWRKDGVLFSDKDVAYGSAKGADQASMAGRAEADGVEVYAKIIKSRTCRPFRAAGMQFDYRRLAHVIPHELASCGLYFGIIVKSGSWFKVVGEEKTLGQGLKSVYARLADDDELRDRIVCQLLDFTDDGDSIDLKAKVDVVDQVDELEQTLALPSVATSFS